MFREMYRKIFALSLILWSFLPLTLSADTIFLSPASGSYAKGQTFTMRVVVSSPAQSINAVSAVVSFPTDKLQVTSVSKIGSILNLWVEEPSFSNSQGRISLEGVVPNPGFQGNSGQVLSVNFRVINEGQANITVSSGSLLANDGYGTNVLRSRGQATFSLNAPAIEPAIKQNQTQSNEETKETIEPTVGEIASPEDKPEELTISFSPPSTRSVANLLTQILSIGIPLLALIYMLVHVVMKGNSSVQVLRKNLRKDLHGLDQVVAKSFDVIKNDIDEVVDLLETAKKKRKLTVAESAILRKLKGHMLEAEDVMHEKITKVEQDLES